MFVELLERSEVHGYEYSDYLVVPLNVSSNFLFYADQTSAKERKADYQYEEVN